MKIKPTIFNISLIMTAVLMVAAYRARGYFAFGGEMLIPVLGAAAHYMFRGGIKNEK